MKKKINNSAALNKKRNKKQPGKKTVKQAKTVGKQNSNEKQDSNTEGTIYSGWTKIMNENPKLL